MKTETQKKEETYVGLQKQREEVDALTIATDCWTLRKQAFLTVKPQMLLSDLGSYSNSLSSSIGNAKKTNEMI